MIFFSPNDVKPDMVTAAPVYIPKTSGDAEVLVEANVAITNEIIVQFYRHRIERVLIFTDDLPEGPIETIPVAPKVDTLLDESLRKEAVTGIRSLFNTADEDLRNNSDNMTTAYQAVKDLDVIIDQLVNTVATESANGLVHINDLKSYDEYTYHHSLSVCVLSITIGQALGFNRSELKRLSRCAIMHDIGKIRVPYGLITKPGRLTPAEFEIVKRHPELGVRYLRSEHIGNEELWRGILHHHEKFDGTGYPLGLKGKEIPLYSRIIAVADVYDAITSYRSYRKPISPPVLAVEMIMGDAGSAFDYDIVSVFVRKLELYPVNTIVELSDKRKGRVTDNKNAMRPILETLDSNSILDLSELRNLSLAIIGAKIPESQP